MGKQEKESRKRGRRRDLQKAVLGVVGAAGLLALGAVAPNAIGALGKLGIIKPTHGYKETGKINRARNRLIKMGLIERNKEGYLRLTQKGEARLRQLQFVDYKLKKPRRWDKKWRVLIFDIPEKRKTLREKVRRTLIAIGFIRLQDSVWVYPYDCEDLVALLKADFKVGKDLLYLIVDSLEGDTRIRTLFHLP